MRRPAALCAAWVGLYVGIAMATGATAESPDPALAGAACQVETVTIDGIVYPVPPQWQGRKIDAPPLLFEDLQQIPPVLTWKETELYLRPDAVAAFVAMAEEAGRDGLRLLVDSSYRSARYQRVIFRRQLARDREFAEIARFIAPPGYSEHMLGTVVDFHPSDWRFAETPEYRWLRRHAAAFGFRETYPREREGGLPWEAWHWRYSGSEDEGGGDR